MSVRGQDGGGQAGHRRRGGSGGAVIAVSLIAAMLVGPAPIAHAGGCDDPMYDSLTPIDATYTDAVAQLGDYLAEHHPTAELILTPDLEVDHPEVDPSLFRIVDWACDPGDDYYVTLDLTVTVPDLIGLTTDDALARLGQRGLDLGTSQTAVPDDWLISAQDVAPDQTVEWTDDPEPTAQVTFAPPIVVPDVTREGPQQARAELLARGLVEGPRHGPPDGSSTIVVRQDPLAGAKVLPGTPVELWLDPVAVVTAAVVTAAVVTAAVVTPPAAELTGPSTAPTATRTDPTIRAVDPTPLGPPGARPPQLSADVETLRGLLTLVLLMIVVVFVLVARRRRGPHRTWTARPRRPGPPAIPPNLVARAHFRTPRTQLALDAGRPDRTVSLVAHTDPGTQRLDEALPDEWAAAASVA